MPNLQRAWNGLRQLGILNSGKRPPLGFFSTHTNQMNTGFRRMSAYTSSTNPASLKTPKPCSAGESKISRTVLRNFAKHGAIERDFQRHGNESGERERDEQLLVVHEPD